MIRTRDFVSIGLIVLVGLAAPVSAEPYRCPAPAEAAGGRSNVHTRYVEANLNPPVKRSVFITSSFVGSAEVRRGRCLHALQAE